MATTHSKKTKHSKSKDKVERKPSLSVKSSVSSLPTEIIEVQQVEVEEKLPSFVFKVISREQTQTLLDADDVDQLETELVEILELKDLTYCLKEGIKLDYFVAGIWWTKQECYNLNQTSAFYTILDELLRNVEKGMCLADNIKELRLMFVGVGWVDESAEPGPVLEGVFNIHQADILASYFYSTLFQHYTLYLTAFNCCQLKHHVALQLMTDTPPQPMWPLPLMDAMPEAVYQKIFDPPSVVCKVEEKTDIPEEPAAEEEEEKEAKPETDAELEARLLANMSPEDIQRVMEEVFKEMLDGLENDVVVKLRAKENEYLQRINNIYVLGC